MGKAGEPVGGQETNRAEDSCAQDAGGGAGSLDDSDPLARVPLFWGFSRQERTQAGRRLGFVQRFPAGTVIFREGDLGQALYVIIAGLVKVGRTTEDGRERTLAILDEGDFFGEMAVVDRGPRSAQAQALEPTTVVAIRGDEFQQWVWANPSVAWRIIQGLSQRLRLTNDQLLEATYAAAQERVEQVLNRLAEQYGESDPTAAGGQRIWRLRRVFTQEELAQLAGTARETVSRVLGRLQDEGRVRWEGRSLIWHSSGTAEQKCDNGHGIRSNHSVPSR